MEQKCRKSLEDSTDEIFRKDSKSAMPNEA